MITDYKLGGCGSDRGLFMEIFQHKKLQASVSETKIRIWNGQKTERANGSVVG
jgi:dTDP-4-dehydrorhamnose 3,5-epimerase-like enzyme